MAHWIASPAARLASIVAAISFAAGQPLLASRDQPRPGGRPSLGTANRAYLEGRYDEVDRLTDKLDSRDPDVAALKARAAIARGRYAQAEAALRPVAARYPASDAALELSLLEQMLGRPDAAARLERVAVLNESAGGAVERAREARALRALGRFQKANAAYRESAAAAPSDPAINTAWGELFLEKYDKAEAAKSFEAALHADARYGPALVGLARSLADDNPPQALALARAALDVNPSDVGAYVFVAGEAVDAGHHDEARQALEKALAVNPASLPAHALLAGLAYVEDNDKEFQAEVARTLAILPSYSDVYRTSGGMAAHHYRFEEAVDLTRRALALQPNEPRALADLGIDLMRTGDEAGAREALEASFKADAYDRITYNLLELLDKLDTFTTVRDGDLILRLPRDEAPVMQDSVLALAHRALATLAARYESRPRGPILIEMFPKHDDFAVRNAGLPGMIGALGACFGRVVTMDSPRAPLDRPGSFQWEATLWHELAHVITLQMSNQRIPRWLTEGISVYEEKRARREWARPMDIEFAERLNRGETLKLRDLNAAFTDPRTINLAYYQAALLVEHIATAYGDGGLQRLVRTYAQTPDTETALRAALNTDFDRLQAGFDQATERLFGGLRRALDGPSRDALAAMSFESVRTTAGEQPRSYPVQMAFGRALAGRGDLDEAMHAYERAAALVPMARGPESPHARMAAIAQQRKDGTRRLAELQAQMDVESDNIELARETASLMREAGIADPARLRAVHQRIAALDPFDAEAHHVLGRLALDANQPESAIGEFRTVLALGPVDRASALTDLAEGYFKGGRRVDAKKQTLAALEIAPAYERAQELLLKLTEERLP